MTYQRKSALSSAEAHFAASDKKTRLFLEEKEEAERKRIEKSARLRALRTAKEAVRVEK